MTVKKLRFGEGAIAALACFAMTNSCGEDADRPNVLIIMADDLGYGDLGFTGSDEISTPHLDRLAAGGVVFRNGYVSHPYCAPSRAGLVTGRYQARFGLEVNVSYSPFDPYMGLPLEEKTFATRLQDSYRTGIIGKWHLGAAPAYQPNNRGFDYFYGFLSGGHTYFDQAVTTTAPLMLEDGAPEYIATEGCYLPLMRNDRAAEFDEYLTTALSKDAARFIANSKEPFCLYVAYNAPHGPMEAPENLLKKYRHIPDLGRRTYAAMVDSMDQGIGIIVDALRQTGKFDNTLIFFLGDNGAMLPSEALQFGDWSNNSPFKRGKGSMFEGGIHVPFLVHWPRGLPAGVTYDAPVIALDIAATAVAVGGGSTEGPPMDGVNLIPYLTGESGGVPHDALFWRIQDSTGWAVRTPTLKYLREHPSNQAPQLFDMVSDPFEEHDLAAERPEDCQRLAGLWNAWNAQNQPNRFVESFNYQKRRLRFFEQMHQDMMQHAARREPVVIR